MAQPPRRRLRLPSENAADITAALEGRGPLTRALTTPARTVEDGMRRPVTRPREIQATTCAEMVQRVAARARETGGPITLSVNGMDVARFAAVTEEMTRDDADRRTAFAESVNRMPAGLIPDDAPGFEGVDLGAAIREAAVMQTLEGLRRNPFMVQSVRDLLNNRPPDFDPENDQLALALARYDAENAPPAPDPEPEEPTPPPAPSRPVRNWGDDE